ncbi:AP2 domain transcription factor AP2X-4 [Toxoplasma gondii GT1]|uniref:AP2 domain transcription factor AP2X-4 n=2 Tax=Toxoplasma gondii TaxID=5811 RepID=S7W4Q7_TOXGG|nr:AP2 domain transcription factor AP2X-4 [Toxoplasma gondii GT1]KAF4640459.1 AP2 domain transcription factor AP2X-4 [Toxoplasma gondii]
MAEMSSADGVHVLSGTSRGPSVPGGTSPRCDSSLLGPSAPLAVNVAGSQAGQVPNGGTNTSPLGWGSGGVPQGYPGVGPFGPQGPSAVGAGDGAPQGPFLNSSFLPHASAQAPGCGGLVGDAHSGGPTLAAPPMASQSPHLSSQVPSALPQMHSGPAIQSSSVHPANASPPSNLSTAAVGSAAFAQQLAAFSSSVGSGNASHSPLPLSSSPQFLLSQYRPAGGPGGFDPSGAMNARSSGPLQGPPNPQGTAQMFSVVSPPQGGVPLHSMPGGPGPNGSLGPGPSGQQLVPGVVGPGGVGAGPGGSSGAAGTPQGAGTVPGGPAAQQGMQQKVFAGTPCAVPAVSLRQIEISAAPRMCPGTDLWGDERKRRARKHRVVSKSVASSGLEAREKREEADPHKGERGADSEEDEDDRTGGQVVLQWIEKEGLAGLHRLLVDALLMPAPKTTNGSRLVSLAARAAQLPPVPGVIYDPHQYQFLARYFEAEDSTVPITKRFPLRRWGFFKSYRFACDVVQQAAKPGVFEDGEIVPVKEPLPGLDGQGLTGAESPPVEYYALPDCPDVSLPVIKGVSRDKKSRRWAVYYRNQRRYFYDKKEEKPAKEKKEEEATVISPHAGVKEAYEMAVQLRRQQVQEVELLQMYEESNTGASQGDDMTLLLPCYQAVLLSLLHNLEKNIRSGGIDCVLSYLFEEDQEESPALSGQAEEAPTVKAEVEADMLGIGDVEKRGEKKTVTAGGGAAGERKREEPSALHAAEELKALRKVVADCVTSHMVYIESARLAVELHEHLAILRECIQKQVLPSDLSPAARLRLVVKFLELQLGSLRDALVQSGFYRQILMDISKRQRREKREEETGQKRDGRRAGGDAPNNTQPLSGPNHVQRTGDTEMSEAEKGQESAL